MVGSSREEKLRGLLRVEETKMGRQPQRAPALYRETMLDTHKTGPTEDFGTAYQNSHVTAGQYGSATMAANNINTARKLAVKRTKRLQQEQQAAATLPGPVEFRSVFKPTPEQEYVCGLATEHRQRIASSEWALLDTLEVELHLQDREARARKAKALQDRQRTHLDQQMQELQGLHAQEEAEKQLDKRVMEEELERYKGDQANKAAQQRQQLVQLRKEQTALLTSTRQAKAAAAAAKKAQEAAELREIAEQLEEGKRQAAARTAAARDAMEATKRDNEARIAARKEEAARQKAADEALMQQTIATLEKQEKEREEKLRHFIASISARADRAGQQAVAENRERAEREARLIKQYDEQKEREYAAKEAATAAKKQAQREQLAKSREAFLQQQAARKAEERAAVQGERQRVDAEAAAEEVAHARKMAGIRDRAAAHKDFLRGQMTVTERHLVEDDTGMSAREKELNARLLNQATRIVGRPQQFSVRLY